MKREVRVGIVGCGKIATVEHVPAFCAIPGVRVVALMDIIPEKVEALRKAHAPEAKGFTNFEEFLASELDAVAICTPNHLHYEQTMAALKAGLHVLCEKPMAPTVARATKMIELAKEMGKVLQINQTLHYLPVYHTAMSLVQSGTIGLPVHIRCIRAGGSTPDKGWSPGATWFVQKACAGGIILDIGVHMAEIMESIVGDVREVVAYTDTRIPTIDVPDNATVLMRFANGATGTLELSWTTPAGAMLLEVYGTQGTLRMFYDQDKPLELITVKNGRHKVSYPKLQKVLNSQQSFIRAVLGKGVSPTPGELGRRAVALCEAIARSGKTRKFVVVPRFE